MCILRAILLGENSETESSEVKNRRIRSRIAPWMALMTVALYAMLARTNPGFNSSSRAAVTTASTLVVAGLNMRV